MPFDSEWPGDAIGAPFCTTSNRGARQARTLAAGRGTGWADARAQTRCDRHATVSALTTSQPGLRGVAESPQWNRL
jgi:hypothetical protein